MTAITPSLWFDYNALEAAEYYVSLFPDSAVIDPVRSAADNPSTKAGEVMVVRFRLLGREYMGINGGPQFPFSEAVSFAIECESQEEADRYWNEFTREGEEGQCGWCKDKFGLSWQVIPPGLGDVLGGPDRDGAARAMRAMLAMKRLDIAALRRAYDNA